MWRTLNTGLEVFRGGTSASSLRDGGVLLVVTGEVTSLSVIIHATRILVFSLIQFGKTFKKIH